MIVRCLIGGTWFSFPRCQFSCCFSFFARGPLTLFSISVCAPMCLCGSSICTSRAVKTRFSYREGLIHTQSPTHYIMRSHLISIVYFCHRIIVSLGAWSSDYAVVRDEYHISGWLLVDLDKKNIPHEWMMLVVGYFLFFREKTLSARRNSVVYRKGWRCSWKMKNRINQQEEQARFSEGGSNHDTTRFEMFNDERNQYVFQHEVQPQNGQCFP